MPQICGLTQIVISAYIFPQLMSWREFFRLSRYIETGGGCHLADAGETKKKIACVTRLARTITAKGGSCGTEQIHLYRPSTSALLPAGAHEPQTGL